MASRKVYNFNPGPATLPREVMLKAQAELVDFERREKLALREDLLDTLRLARRFASDTSGAEALDKLAEDVQRSESDSTWLRETHRRTGSLSDVVRAQCRVWQTGQRVYEA